MIVGDMLDEQDELRQSIAALLAARRFGVLATRGAEQPHLSLVAIAVNDDLESILFATERLTQKYFNLRSHPRAAILIDNRSELADNLDQGVAVTATGRTEELRGAGRAAARGFFLSKHPYMVGFVTPQTCAILRLGVDDYRLVHGLSEVHSLHIPQTKSMTPDRGEDE